MSCGNHQTRVRFVLPCWTTVVVTFVWLLLSSTITAKAELVAHWSFDDLTTGGQTSETAAYTGGPFTGTGIGDPQLTSTAQFGNAWEFDSDDYMTTANTADLNLSHFTISTWVRATGKEEYTIIAMKGNGMEDESSWALLGPRGSDNTFNFNVLTSTHSSWQTVQANSSLNSWYHLVGTYDGSNMKLYVNGNEPISATTEGALLQSSTSPIYIGTNDKLGTTQQFIGQIDDFGVWNTSLNGAEARALYTLADDAEVNYNLGQANALFTAYANDTSVILDNGHTWTPVAGLNAIANEAEAGDVFHVGGTTYLLMDTAGEGTGLKLVPEPYTTTLLALALIGWALTVRRRRTAGAKQTTP